MTNKGFIIIWALFTFIFIFVSSGDNFQRNLEDAPRLRRDKLHHPENRGLRSDFKIAVIKSRDSTFYNAALKGFRKVLEDKNVKDITSYNMEDDPRKGREIISKIKTKKLDLILTLGTMATTVASEDIKDLPIVFSAVLNPVDSGLVKDMKSSGNNLTGASMDIPIKTQFEWLKKVAPSIKTIGVLYNPDETKVVIDKASKIAEIMTLKLIAVPVHSEKDVPKATNGLLRKVDALWSVADTTVFGLKQSRKFILLKTLREKIPFMGLSRFFVQAGALLALSCDYEDIGRQSGELAVRILAGEKPSQIPITVPRKISLLLNLKVAERIGIKIPRHIINEADEVFK